MTPSGWLQRDGLRLAVHDAGGPGRPVLFQHGLCGDARQTAEAFPAHPGFRRVTLDCRGHGASDLGGPYRIATFAEDVAALAESLGPPVVMGGISLGAAIALRLAVLRPDLVSRLVLVRPAWGTAAAPERLAPNVEVGALLAGPLDAAAARAAFLGGPTAARLRTEAPDNLASLSGFFTRTPRAGTAALLREISIDGPGLGAGDLAALRLPVLVVGSAQDLLHPLSLARGLAAAIPEARLVEVPPKGRDRHGHFAALHAALKQFLEET